MKVIKVKNNLEAGTIAGDILLKKIISNPKAILGLATGSTPITTYQYMLNKTHEDKIDWSNITTFNLDEYKGIAPTHEQSYRYFMNENLFNYINIKKENTFVPSGDINSNEEAAEYDEQIKKAGGIDIQLLGLGLNGHIGFNEPGTKFYSVTSIVDLTESTIDANARFFEKKSDVPTQAISMGLQTISQSKEILLIATGENKAEAVFHLIEGAVSEEWPCSVLQKHDNVTVIIDEAAASLLKNH